MNQTPLWSAVVHNRVRVVRVLLEAGAKFDLRDDSGDTLLESAIWAEATGAIRLLLEAGADPNQVAEGAPAALHWAVAKDAAELVDLLLEAGADPNLGLPGGRDTGMFEGLRRGATPLMIATQKGNLPLVDRFLEAGADWRLKDSKGKTAVDVATRAGHVHILKRLEEAGAKVNYRSKRLHNAALLEAVEQQNAERVRQALAGGARTDLKQKHTDRSPLMQACLDGNPHIVQQLLDAGADPNVRTQWGEYALTNAVVRGNVDTVRRLLAADAEVNIEYQPRSVPSGKRNTVIPSRFCPLADAASQGTAVIVDLLLEAGADPNQLAPHGDNPLLSAVTSRRLEIARRLLAAGAQPRAEDADYLDILHWEKRAAEPAYRQTIQEIQKVAGVRAERFAGLPEARSFRFSIPEEESSCEDGADQTEAMLEWSQKFSQDYQSLAEQVSAVIDDLQQSVAKRGYHLLDGGMPLGCGPMTRFLVLLPTADPFAVMAALGTYGNDDELSNRDLIAWFRDFKRDHPFALRGCKYDTVVIELERPLADPKKWAKRLIEFDSDIWHEDLSRFEKHLETATRIHFWWD
jgi:ankyrin repeat protein